MGYIVTIERQRAAPAEAAGRPCDGMTFGMAIEAMKRGAKVARK